MNDKDKNSINTWTLVLTHYFIIQNDHYSFVLKNIKHSTIFSSNVNKKYEGEEEEEEEE